MTGDRNLTRAEDRVLVCAGLALAIVVAAIAIIGQVMA